MPETNIVFFDTTAAGVDPKTFVARALAKGVRLGFISRRVRAVTHMDVSRADVESAVAIIRQLLKSNSN
jgi:threonine aldolase